MAGGKEDTDSDSTMELYALKKSSIAICVLLTRAFFNVMNHPEVVQIQGLASFNI